MKAIFDDIKRFEKEQGLEVVSLPPNRIEKRAVPVAEVRAPTP
jgi:hypothetical protein